MKRLPLVLVLAAVSAVTGPATPDSSADGCPLPCSGQSASPPSSKLLFVQPAGPLGPLVAYDTGTGRRRFALPAGVASADGWWHVTGARRGDTTRLVRYSVATGRSVRVWSVHGRWTLAALSPSGRWLALSRRSERPSRTRIAIVDAVNGREGRVFTLRGDFEVETVSADGRRLFLIQHLRSSGSPRYLVRLFDLAAARLRSRPLRAPGADTVMAGFAWSGVASPDGRWLLTLYLDTRRRSAFVHALDLARSSPACIDLPSRAGSFERLTRYTLTLSPDGRRLYAANAALGAVAEIDLRTRRVARIARFRPAFAAAPGRAVTLSGTISRNGRTLYFSDGRDLWAYDAAAARVRGPYRTGGKLLGFGFGGGDRRVFALRADGRMLAFDAATGVRVRG